MHENHRVQIVKACDIKGLLDSLNSTEKLEVLENAIAELPPEDRAHLLAKQAERCGLSIVIGSSNTIHSSINLQIGAVENLADVVEHLPKEQLGELLQAIAGAIGRQ